MNCNYKCEECTLGLHGKCESPTICHVTYGGIENSS